MTRRLKACPFCGVDVEREQHKDECYFVVDRIAKTRAQLGDFSKDPTVYDAWNRRATQPAAGEPVAMSVGSNSHVNLPERKSVQNLPYQGALIVEGWNYCIDHFLATNPHLNCDRPAATHGDDER